MPFCVTANPGRRLESPPDILSEPQLGRTRPMACDRDRQRKDDAILLVISEGAPHVKTIDSQDSRSPEKCHAFFVSGCTAAQLPCDASNPTRGRLPKRNGTHPAE